MHYYLLENIVERFGCNIAKEVLEQFTNQNYDHKREIKDLPDFITGGEIEQYKEVEGTGLEQLSLEKYSEHWKRLQM